MKTGNPGYAQHRLEHEKLTKQVLALQEEFANGKAAVTMEIMQFLSDWLRNHIQINDQKVSAYIRQRPGVLARA